MKETILITGATGFLGSRLLHKLLDSGQYNIIIFKRSFSDTVRLSDIIDRKKIKYIDLDIVNENYYKDFFASHTIDIIIHCATYYGREASVSITKVLETNLMFPLSLIEEAVKHGLKLFINTDSYFNKPNQTYKTLLDYSLSKKTLNLWLEYIATKVKVANLRLEHIYGENDSPTKFVEAMIRKIAFKKEDSIALTYGQQLRDFIYIDDVCDAYIAVLNNYKKYSFHYLTFEVGTGKTCSIRKFVETIKKISDSSSKLEFGKLPYREDEIMSSYADTCFLQNLGWHPKTTIEQGIEKIIQHYRSNGFIIPLINLQESKLHSDNHEPVISLCIPSSGRTHFLKETLNSIFEQQTDTSLFEVCISDNSDNEETRKLLENEYADKKNIKYKKSTEYSYLNLIEALKMANGTYLKLLNDYTYLNDKQTLNYMINTVSKYAGSNTVVFFSLQEKNKEPKDYNNFDSFLKNVSYIETAAPCFGIYKSVFYSIMKSGVTLNYWFPHVTLLHNQAAEKYIVDDTKILKSLSVKKKGGYNLPMVFGNEYIKMNELLLNTDKISRSTFDFVRLETLDFIANWYSRSKYDKKHCSFDFSEMKNWLSNYYNEREIKDFFILARNYNKKQIIRKIFSLVFIVVKILKNLSRIMTSRKTYRAEY
ncbi:MAG: NAD-dependent epimerase/dehydratase family protein [Treponema sp.]|nr:NAD-dependent epimerase/dehydratase family protein [Treponema sp.]